MYALHAYIRMHYMHRNVCMRLANKLNISIGHGPLTFESVPGLPRPLPGRRDPPAETVTRHRRRRSGSGQLSSNNMWEARGSLQQCSMVVSLRKVDTSHPIDQYIPTYEHFLLGPPLRKSLGAPLIEVFRYTFAGKR